MINVLVSSFGEDLYFMHAKSGKAVKNVEKLKRKYELSNIEGVLKCGVFLSG